MIPKTTAFICMFTVCSAVCAQDLHIHYNVFRDSVSYLQQGKLIEKPIVRKGSTVFLHVENYNNYLYDLSVEIEKEDIQVAKGSDGGMLRGLMPGGAGSGMPLNFLFKGGDQMLGKFNFFTALEGADLREGSGFVTDKAEEERLERVAQLKQLESEFRVTRKNIIKMDAELKTMQEQVQKNLADQRLQVFALEEVDRIRFNQRLEPNQIRTLTAEYMERIFEEKDPTKIDLDQVLKVADKQNELPQTIENYRMKVQQYADSTENCAQLMEGFRKFDFPKSNLKDFRSDAEAFLAAASSKKNSLQENADMLKSKMGDIKTLDPKSLSELRTTFLEINTNHFSKTYRHIATGEKLTLKTKLTPIDSLQQRGMKSLELSPLTVNVYGGMRVRASVGLNFGRFFNRPQAYFVRDSLINSSDLDAFVPVVTSFVHFYAPNPRSVSLAGSFGVGFPLGGGENLQSISFFLGPSLLFGKGERIVINAGLMGGKVERLAQGYKIGDGYQADSNLAPTSAVYELGYYLGVSFNLTGGEN